MSKAKDLSGHIEWTRGTLRVYAGAGADEQFRQMKDFEFGLEVTKLSAEQAILTCAVAWSYLAARTLRATAVALLEGGFKTVYVRRGCDRQMPFGVYLDSGPLAGHYKISCEEVANYNLEDAA